MATRFTYTRVAHDGLRERVDVERPPGGVEGLDWIHGRHADDEQGRALSVVSALLMTKQREARLMWEAYEEAIEVLRVVEDTVSFGRVGETNP